MIDFGSGGKLNHEEHEGKVKGVRSKSFGVDGDEGILFVFGRSNSDSDEFFWGPILAGITTLFFILC